MTDEAMAAFTRRLFGRPEQSTESEDAEADRPPNHVPTEGANPNPGPGRDMQTFVAALFEHARNQI